MSFSIIIPTFNQEEALRAQLPLLLQQEDIDEVVVVNMDSEDDTKSYLEGLELIYPHLKHTYTPHSSSHNDVRNLAIMLGCRAASNQQILLTLIDESGLNPLLSMTPSQIEAAFQQMQKEKRTQRIMLRPHSSESPSTLWHQFLGCKHFFNFLTSKRSKRTLYNYQILLIK